MKNLFRILFIFVLLSPFYIKAQTTQSTDSVIRISFRSTEKQQVNKKKKRKSDEENIIKIAPLDFISGNVPVLYEKVINDFFTIQGGIGITSKNYIRSAFQEVNDNFVVNYPWIDETQYLDVADKALTFNNRVAKTGYAFSLEPRFYFESDAPEDGYFGISYGYYKYKFAVPGIVALSSSEFVHKGSMKNEYENISDLSAVFGYQNVNDRLTVDYSFGIGIRNVKGVKYCYGQDLSGNSNNIEGFGKYKQSLINMSIGLKVGYHF